MSTSLPAVDFLVNRANLSDCRFVPAPAAADVELAAGEVLVAVDRFALTANNVTYAVAGEMLNYWSFFPAEAGWGRIPVWGFADVVKSKHDAVSTGERLYGYYPISSWLRIRPGEVTPAAIVDGSAHRKDLPPIYNRYLNAAAALQQRTARAWRAFLAASKDWIRVVHGRGAADVERVYRETLEGKAGPNEGHVLSLQEE